MTLVSLPNDKWELTLASICGLVLSSYVEYITNTIPLGTRKKAFTC